MSRIANNPVSIPAGVEVKLGAEDITVKGANGTLNMPLNANVDVALNDNVITFKARHGDKKSVAMSGTMRALVGNMVTGVSQGFEKKLQLVGVGYRTKVSGNTLNLTLGFSHPVDYELPEGVKAETPSQTDIVLKSANKQLLGQVAAEIRAFRPPEPYKGKGVRFADEHVRRKEAKKK
ncbi:50S ribosomal protein L6 [Umboniibacter marinipuniceus]|uniref:Large ribosomal subunit protein uL6 n=1 Tax=Umboniibacter marinipuniceus TaxID=569599 RepID=A0A3M0A1E7_9GAMM|nr:50S ribosomal protein L6 [Umboniibacter marinipuniceus]RMA78436.1 LSU ribosomal protein L6P [Umboniibacter marinipuniceus]